LFEAVARAILIRREPLLLFLDDVQWCDRETLDWLHYVLQFDATAPLLIVATLRQEEADDNEALSTLRLLLQKSATLTEVSLARFDALTTTTLAASLREHDLAADEAALIYRETEGNPLFVVELMRAGGHATDQTVVTTEQTLPPKVQATIQYRLSQLSAQAQALIQIAAVIGREFTFEVLARASEANEDALVQGLDELWRKRIVREQGANAYDFSHDKIRVVAYTTLSATRRRVLHRKVAEALNEVYAPDLDGISAQIAQHYEIAGQADRAIEFYRRAAQAAQRIYANDEAIGHYRYLLDSDLAQYLSAEDVCAINLALGEVWRVNGQWPQAEAINREALARAEKLGAARLMAQAQRALADVMRLQGHYDAALEWLTRAETGFEAAGDRRGVVSTLWTMGEVYWFKGNNLRSLAALDRQLQIATEINDQRGLCEALDTMGMVYWSQGDWDRSVECCLKSIAIAEPLGYKLVITRAAITLGNVGVSRRDQAMALQWYQTAYEIAREIDDRQILAWAINNTAGLYHEAGDFLRALAYFECGIHLALDIGDTWTATLDVSSLAEVVLDMHLDDVFEEFSRTAIHCGKRLGIPGYVSSMLSDHAEVLMRQGQLTEAEITLNEAQNMAATVDGERLGGEDSRFEMAVLDIRLRCAQKRISAREAVSELERALSEFTAIEQRAALAYEIWRIDVRAETYCEQAASLYRDLYEHHSAWLFAHRYQELTGQTLPPADRLPDLPGVTVPDDFDFSTFLDRARRLMDDLTRRLG
jgi:tetratricopeptide (TPR) repeat protein